MITDLTAPAAREQRDSLASRTDVLDKVGIIASLPGDMHCTTDMVATFFEVDRETVLTVVKRNRDELDNDGYRVITRGAFEETFNMNVPSSASRIALFPRRAVLRVGMLLRDSQIARRVRDYLLDTERPAQIETLTPLEYALRLVDAEKRVLEAQAQAEVGEKFKRAIEGGDGLSLRAFHKKYFSAIAETDFMEHLYLKSYLIDQRGKGSLRTEGPKAGTHRDGSQHRHPSFKGKKFFYLHTGGVYGGKRRESTRVRPGEWELMLRDQLAHEGLSANENSAGLFAIEGGKARELA
ncbi:hypothetical protein [Rhodococcus artemisiae]|uniref:Antirepressor protein C-terminal domain-containing protein n=1 Tax=Rhodococcus artemisiae TaxID=714159 RepID=A0ABU7LC96_9NOCA|nr:hypothetical protein [Rhodococcus artemisiae]MEE2058934.1 hypothetical protein [Rhodococcus artemisiae]